MTANRTSQGDPARTLTLLWRQREDSTTEERPRKGPRQRLDVDAVVAAAIAVADGAGLEALTMRAIADRLGVSTMSLYTYVPGKAELLDLMLDTVYAAMPRPPFAAAAEWRRNLRAVADRNRDLFRRHPWAARISTARPALGPGTMAKYEYELGPFDGLGLDDVEIDAALTYLLGFVQANAVAAQETAALSGESGVDDAGWWSEAGPLLERFVTAAEYPLASRIGSAAGAEQGAAYDPDAAYAFGLERVLDGFGVLIEGEGGR